LTNKVPLTETDCWIAGCIAAHGSTGIGLSDLLDTYDFAMRMQLDFDEVSYAIPRLVAADLVNVDLADHEVHLRPTTHALQLRDRRLGNGQSATWLSDEAWVWRPGPEPDEDRSLGRFTGLDREAYDRAVASYSAEVRRLAEPLIRVVRGFARRSRGRCYRTSPLRRRSAGPPS
jgi:hypothetical protein